MTIEEKAKAYDEALGKVKALYATCAPDSLYLEELFSILKESEDERIRKEINELIMQPTWKTEKEFHRRKELISWLEKQGEQETLCDKCRKEQPSHSCQDITALGRCAVEHEQNPVDKIEPKFNIGDWVINSSFGNVKQIKEFDNDERVWFTDGTGTPFEFLNGYRLWNIQDAKEGDVLVSDETTVLFQSIDEPNIKCHCTWFRVNDNDLRINTLQNSSPYFPATKEQCAMFFARLNEEGYVWDAEKKELKKIEDNPIPITDEWIEEYWKHHKVTNPDSYDKGEEIQFGHDGFMRFCKRYCKKNAWKPSKEQIIALRWVLTNVPYNKHKEEISGLLEQIKDL